MILCGSDIIVRSLIEQGCETVFGYPGGQIINVYDSLYKYKDEINHVLSAHEQGAAHAADAYARASGKVGVVIATSGPGATNLVTGIATAFLDSIPMVAITGNVVSTQIGSDSFQEIDITGITLPITKHNYFVSDVTKLAGTIREAFVLAMSGRPGPVLIDVPKDVQIAQCEYEEASSALPEEKSPAKQIRIEQAAKIVNSCDRPYVYFGGGALFSGACEKVLELAELIDAPIGCSFMGLSGVPTDHPRFLGMQGMHGHYASSIAMHEADCIIACGNRFNDRVTGKASEFSKKAKIVQIDIDGAELSKNIIADVGLRGDLTLTLDKLFSLLEKKEHKEWISEIERLKKIEKENLDDRSGLTPRNIIQKVNEHIKPTTPVITDVGQHQMWAAQYLNLKNPRTFISSGGLGTMGFGMGAAIGAAYGTKEHVLLITGDGSFGMTLHEMATAVSHEIPMVILIMNNGVLGMVRQWQTLFFDKHYSNTVLDRKTDFVEVAKAFGADGVDVNSLEELDSALAEGFETKGPFLINCVIDKDEFVLPMLPPGGTMDDIITRIGD